MEVQTIKEFAKAKGFVQLALQVRTNTNGYPYITFINAENVAENVYFSKDAGAKVTAGQIIDAAMVTTHQIGLATNAAGEVRYKIIGNSDRIDLTDLFGE